MRNTLVNLILKEAEKNPNIYFLTADLGYSVIEEFQRKLPKQCINVGISEQNMVGIAAGLALNGKKVFVYSIVPFATMRCFEQIKVDICYQNLDVTVIGVGGGFAYGSLGPTHHAVEDIAVMSSLPNMKVVCFADSIEVKALFPQINELGGPTYLRLNRGGESDIHPNSLNCKFGKAITVKKGNDIALVATGRILEVVVELAKMLKAKDINAEVISMPTVKPLDKNFLFKLALRKNAIFTFEEHNIVNGFGTMIAGLILENHPNLKLFKRFGIEDVYPKNVGTQEYLRDLNNLSAEKLYKIIKKIYGKRQDKSICQ